MGVDGGVRDDYVADCSATIELLLRRTLVRSVSPLAVNSMELLHKFLKLVHWVYNVHNMLIRFDGKYKSLNSFESQPLGDFSVITGKNGSGKTHLLQLINIVYTNQSNSHKLSITPEPLSLQYEGIEFKKIEILQGQSQTQQLLQTYQVYWQIAKPVKEFIVELLKQGLNPYDINKDIDPLPFMKENDENEKYNRLYDLLNRFMGGIAHARDEDQMKKTNRQKISKLLNEWKRAIITAINICDYKGKDFISLTKNDFFSTPLIETDYTTYNSFTIQLEHLFFGYARKRFVNEIEYNRKVNYGDANRSISDSEFVKNYPPPWEQINKILSKHGFKLRVMEIDPKDFSPEFELALHFVNIDTNEPIALEELSSGEKIIIGLIIRLFLTQQYKSTLQFPDFMLFDEPDAFLHPEISSLLIEVLHETFVKELGIKVIITTHSPSTVALAPDESIYELKNGINTSLKKVSKDFALKLLTENLPLLSINYSNHRQVFVESPTDQYYYQSVFNKLKSGKQTLFDLYFITTGYGKSNCAEVIKLSNELRNAGNNTCYGIIDWDGKNASTEFIFVHGFGKRYSIENFILDPIYLCILFIEQKCANQISELEFNNSYNQYLLVQEENSRLQQVSNWVTQKVSEKFPSLDNSLLVQVEYANGKVINLPSWYLSQKGHEIEEKLRSTFPSLAAFKNEGELQKRLTEISSKCFPFIPLESFTLIKQISNADTTSVP